MADLRVAVLGGRLRGQTLSVAEMLVGGSWERLPPLEAPRGSLSAVAVGSSIWAVAGGGRDSNLDSCEELRFSGGQPADAWVAAPPLRLARHALALASSGSRLYVVAGQGLSDGHYGSMTDVEVYDPEHQRWQPGPPLRVARRRHGACASEGIVYAFGGAIDETAGAARSGKRAVREWNTATAEALDERAGRWRDIAPLPVAAPCSAVAVDGCIYVLLEGHSLLRYLPDEDKYVKLCALPVPEWHSFSACAAPGGRIVAVGGASRGKWLRAAYVYSVATGRWEELPQMKVPRRRAAVVVLPCEDPSPAAAAALSGSARLLVSAGALHQSDDGQLS
eukprot:TRINITY_DN42936_c0_g1_i1.p1 TRINITY_DN42936_c0_g1~~TRINITY_DN42936_c0_g1_i1.p1  ORF type:complete len:335 (+),score=77.49 TRINITY_DN42936_c0_g1_i1:81-1085(+)